MDPHSNGHGGTPPEHDPVAANRAVNPRRAPGRPELGLDVTRRAAIAAMVMVAAATGVLIVILAGAR